MEKEEFLRLLSKKVADGLDREEQIAFDIYLSNHRGYVPVVEQLQDFFVYEDLNIADKEQELHFQKLSLRMGDVARPKKSRLVIWRATALVAACLLLFFVWNYWSDRGRSVDDPMQTVYQEVQSSEKNYWLTLDDGTSVILSRGAALRYNEAFGRVERMASLKGSARFDVVKNAVKPMHIDLGTWEAVVKGTLFDIQQNYVTDQKELTLYHGKVELINKKDPTQLLSILPNQKVSWKADASRTRDMQVDTLSPQELVAARQLYQDSLVFSKIAFKDLAIRLKERYRKEFVFENPEIANRLYTGKIWNIKLQELLHIMSTTNPFEYEIKDSVVIIK